MKKNIFTCTLFLLISLCGYSQNPSGLEDRTYWITVLTKIADPVLENMSKGELKKNMPVETISGALNPPNTRTTHLEALGRLLVGMAPWLELGPDETEEGRLRSKYIRLMLLSIDNGFNPDNRWWTLLSSVRGYYVLLNKFGGIFRTRLDRMY